MNRARSIKQNPLPDALPDFRNLGVLLRILIICNGLVILFAFFLAGSWGDFVVQLLKIAAIFSPVLLGNIVLLWLLNPQFKRLSYTYGVLLVYGLVITLTLFIYALGDSLYQSILIQNDGFMLFRALLLGVVVCSVVLVYLRWRSQVLSRALHDARLQALRARIRPHFLFNTINAVLSIVRTHPKQAETALEDMSDLFRMAMADTQDFVPLQQEVQLSKQYLALEQLRMGERLKVIWQIENCFAHVFIPPLLLQPLLENAVYHGIEPLSHGGCIQVTLVHVGDQLQLKVENPISNQQGAMHDGNRMALQNIRERLALLFDVEADYQVEQQENYYRVSINLPWKALVREEKSK